MMNTVFLCTFVLLLLESHDSVSLCVVLLNKIRFVFDFVIIQI